MLRASMFFWIIFISVHALAMQKQSLWLHNGTPHELSVSGNKFFATDVASINIMPLENKESYDELDIRVILKTGEQETQRIAANFSDFKDIYLKFFNEMCLIKISK